MSSYNNKPYWHNETIENTKKDNTSGCGCFFLIVFICLIILGGFILSYIYTSLNNAPKSCIFARDVVTCVQISKEK